MCRKCKIKKSDDEYYVSNPNECKECARCRIRQNRIDKAEYYKEYDRKRYQDDPRVRERHRRYQATEEGKKAMNASRKKWKEKNPLKRAAHNLVNNALRDGKITKPNTCQECGTKPKRIEGHHCDYSKPLNISWLCRQCHVNAHKIPF